MTKGFSKRRIISSETLGEKLRSAREKIGATLAEAELATKVRIKHLYALEAGDWQNLPNSVYVRGFVLAYSKYLNLDKTEIMKLLETESKIHSRSEDRQLVYKSRIRDAKFVVTPKTIGYSLLSLFVVAMFSYMFYQIKGFAGSPDLKVATPINNSVVESDMVEIKGVTENSSTLTINNETIPVTNDGSFVSNIKLHSGVNVIAVVSANRIKKESSEILTIEYKPKTAQATESITNQ